MVHQKQEARLNLLDDPDGAEEVHMMKVLLRPVCEAHLQRKGLSTQPWGAPVLCVME